MEQITHGEKNVDERPSNPKTKVNGEMARNSTSARMLIYNTWLTKAAECDKFIY